MAGLLDSLRRLCAPVGARKRSGGAPGRPSLRRTSGPRLRGVESLEDRTLLSVSPLGLERTVGLAGQAAAEPALNRLIVRFDDATPLESARSIAAELGGTLVSELPSIHGAVIEIDAGGNDVREATATAARAWSARPGVLYAEPDRIYRVAATFPNDPRFSELWGMHNTGASGGVADADIDAPEAWDMFRGSSNVVVAVIDSGVDYTHPDLAANMWVNPGEIPNNGVDDDGNGWIDDVYGIDTYNQDSNPMDDDGHGTHVSGTIGAVGNNNVGVVGVNWNVKIMALKFLGLGGGTTSGAVQAIDYMTRMKTQYGVNIVASNNSWGGGGYSLALYDAIRASNNAGIMFVAAAGNGGFDGIGDDNDQMPSYPASYDLPGIIAVAATDRSDRLASFSNYGRTSVDLAAPGVEILSSVPASLYGVAYEAWDGTSMAAPHVTGAVALGMAFEPGASLAEIKQLVLNSVDVLPALQNRTVSGGRLNVFRFMTSFNVAPVLTTAGPFALRTMRQGDMNPFGTRIAALLQSAGANPITDLNPNAKQGIAVIAANTTQGAWEYTTNNGVTWRPLGRVSNASARLLAADTATRIRFRPNVDYVGTVSPAIVFRAWDQTSGANGGLGDATTHGGRTAFSVATATATITVAPANFAPVLNTSASFWLDAIDQTPIGGPEPSNPGTLLSAMLSPGGVAAITDGNGDPPGIAVIGADSSRGVWEYWLGGASDWMPLGSPSPAQALLLPADSETRLRFRPQEGFYGTLNAGISFRAWDQTSGSPGELVDAREVGGQTAFSRDAAAASITVRWINVAPVLQPGEPLRMTPIAEDDQANPGTLVSQILTSLAPAPYPITDIDGDMSPGLGIAVTQADETNGSWWYSTDGAQWQAIAGLASEGNALLLAADNATRLRFQPHPDFNTANPNLIPTLVFRAWDRTSGANGSFADASVNGGSTAFSVATRGISVEVVSRNDPPAFVKGPDQTVWEDSPLQTVVGWATLFPQPDDEADQTIWFEATADKPELFSFGPEVSPEGTLRFTPAPNAFGTAMVTVRARDNGGSENGGQDTSAPQTFAIAIQGVNDAPAFIAGPDQVVDENAPRQTVVGWATGIHCGPGETGQAVWFVVEANTDPDLFAEQPAISPDGTLTYRVAPNANGTARITFTLRDDGGTAHGGRAASDPWDLAITVNPVNGKPVALGARLTADWGVPIDFDLLGDDGDPGPLEDQHLTFALASLPTLGRILDFDAATGAVTYVPNVGAKGVDRFTFTVTDDATAGNPPNLISDPATVEIRIDPLVEVPPAAGTNHLLLRKAAGQLVLDLTVGKTTRRLFSEPLADVQKLTILGAVGNPDQLTVDLASGGSFGLPDGLVFDGRSFGMDALAVRGTPRADAFLVEEGQLTVNPLTSPLAIVHQNVGQIQIDGGAGNDAYTLAALGVPVRIVDSSGVEMLDFSPWIYGSGVNLDLSLAKGQAQQVNALAAALALSGTFENAIGSPWNDVIRGNAAANRLEGGDGNDELYGLGGNDLLFGGAGDDVLYAGAGVDLLVGGLGNDRLFAGAGKSVLIGGAGADILQGGSNETIFIGGETQYDANNQALLAIVREWGSTRSFADRVKRLRAGVGANPPVLLALNTTVFDDLVQDRMIGGRGKEWFLAFGTDSVENFGAGDVRSTAGAATL